MLNDTKEIFIDNGKSDQEIINEHAHEIQMAIEGKQILTIKDEPLILFLCRNNNISFLKEIMKSFHQLPNVDEKDDEGKTAVFRAIEAHNHDMVDFLIEAGAKFPSDEEFQSLNQNVSDDECDIDFESDDEESNFSMGEFEFQVDEREPAIDDGFKAASQQNENDLYRLIRAEDYEGIDRLLKTGVNAYDIAENETFMPLELAEKNSDIKKIFENSGYSFERYPLSVLQKKYKYSEEVIQVIKETILHILFDVYLKEEQSEKKIFFLSLYHCKKIIKDVNFSKKINLNRAECHRLLINKPVTDFVLKLKNIFEFSFGVNDFKKYTISEIELETQNNVEETITSILSNISFKEKEMLEASKAFSLNSNIKNIFFGKLRLRLLDYYNLQTLTNSSNNNLIDYLNQTLLQVISNKYSKEEEIEVKKQIILFLEGKSTSFEKYEYEKKCLSLIPKVLAQFIKKNVFNSSYHDEHRKRIKSFINEFKFDINGKFYHLFEATTLLELVLHIGDVELCELFILNGAEIDDECRAKLPKKEGALSLFNRVKNKMSVISIEKIKVDIKNEFYLGNKASIFLSSAIYFENLPLCELLILNGSKLNERAKETLNQNLNFSSNLKNKLSSAFEKIRLQSKKREITLDFDSLCGVIDFLSPCDSLNLLAASFFKPVRLNFNVVDEADNKNNLKASTSFLKN